MKPQDLIFIIVIVTLLLIRKEKWLIISGLICLVLAIPFFSFWIFFTGQRFVYYAWAFFLVATVMLLFKKK